MTNRFKFHWSRKEAESSTQTGKVLPSMTNVQKEQAPRWLVILFAVYGLLLAGLTILNWLGADRWWLGAFNLYLPQALWLIPIVPLALLSLRYAPRWLWALGVLLVWVLGPIMGFRWPLNTQPISGSPGTLIRVMTCNVKQGQRDIHALMQDIGLYRPDVVLLQEADQVLKGPLSASFTGWNVRSFNQYVIASRLPLGPGREVWIPYNGGKWPCLRTQVQVGNSVITLYSAHFMTPREGLNAFRAARKQPRLLPEAIQRLQENVEVRLLQAQSLSDFVRQEPGAVIVAGDLNSPDASLACRMLRTAGLHDAFTEGGRGYGYTYGHFLLSARMPWLDLSWMRIDHIMLSRHLQAQRCWTGTGKASDHRPVIVDVIVGAI